MLIHHDIITITVWFRNNIMLNLNRDTFLYFFRLGRLSYSNTSEPLLFSILTVPIPLYLMSILCLRSPVLLSTL